MLIFASDRIFNTMALDRQNKNASYLLGRMVAITKEVCKDAPYTLVALTAVNPKQKYSYWFEQTSKRLILDSQYSQEWQEILSMLPADYEFPSHLAVEDQGRVQIGYYHQKAYING